MTDWRYEGCGGWALWSRLYMNSMGTAATNLHPHKHSDYLISQVVGVALLVIIVSKLLWSLKGKETKKMKLPPGPTALPIIGSLHLLGTSPHVNLTKLAEKHGPMMSMWLGQQLCIVATSADAAKELLKLQDANFANRPSIRAAELLLPGDMVLHDLTPVLRHLRKILVGELMTPARLRSSQYIRTEEMAAMLYRISQTKGSFQLKKQLNIMSTNILSRMIMSKRFLGVEDGNHDLVEEFNNLTCEMSSSITTVHLGDFFKFIPKWMDLQGLDSRMRKIRVRMDRFYWTITDQHIAERRLHKVSDAEKTLLDVLLDQLDVPECGVTDGNINGVIWNALTAGTDTTTLTIEWAMAEVLNNPNVLKKAREEVDCVVGLDRMVQESDISELKYIQAITKETLRLHPPLPLLIPHKNCAATKAYGYDIPENTRVMINVWALGRDPKSWENPTQFTPDRFMNGSTDENVEVQGQHYMLLPFGSGRRQCPGMGLAHIIVHLQIATLLHAFDWDPEGLNVIEGPPGITLWKRDPVTVVAKPRLPLHLYKE